MVSELSEDGNWVWDGSKWNPTNHQNPNHLTSPNQSRGSLSIKESNRNKTRIRGPPSIKESNRNKTRIRGPPSIKESNRNKTRIRGPPSIEESNRNFNSEEIQLQKKPMGENLEDKSLQEKPFEISGMPRILIQMFTLGWFPVSIWLFLEDSNLFLIIFISPIFLFVIFVSTYVLWNMLVIDRSWFTDAINDSNQQKSSNTEDIQVVNSTLGRKIGIDTIFSFLLKLAGFVVGVFIGITQLQKGNLGGAMRSFTGGISNPQGLTEEVSIDSTPLGTSTYSCQLPSCNYRFSNVLNGKMIGNAPKRCPNCGSSVMRDLYGSAIPVVSNLGDMGRVSYQCMLLSCSYSVGPVVRGTDVGRCMNCGSKMSMRLK